MLIISLDILTLYLMFYIYMAIVCKTKEVKVETIETKEKQKVEIEFTKTKEVEVETIETEEAEPTENFFCFSKFDFYFLFCFWLFWFF